MQRIYSKTLLCVVLLVSGVSGVRAQERGKEMLSGTSVPSTVNLQTGTETYEYDLAGSNVLGQITLRVVSAAGSAPQASSSCSGLYIPVTTGEGVLRSSNGSLLKLNLTSGFDCIDLQAGQAHCVRTFQTLGGTGRFRNSSGSVVTLDMTVFPAVPGKLDLTAVTASLTGRVAGVDLEGSAEGEQ